MNTSAVEQEIDEIKYSLSTSTQRMNDEINQQVSSWNGWLDDVSKSLKGIDEPLDLSKGAVEDFKDTAVLATQQITTAFSDMTNSLDPIAVQFADAMDEMKESVQGVNTSLSSYEKLAKACMAPENRLAHAIQTGRSDLINEALFPTSRMSRMNDFIMRKGAPPVPFNPKDTIIGTKTGATGQNVVFSPNITVNATVNNDVDVDRLKDKLSREWVDELRERIRSGN
jgi:hypothetical protein